jgi:hypothetical protein
MRGDVMGSSVASFCKVVLGLAASGVVLAACARGVDENLAVAAAGVAGSFIGNSQLDAGGAGQSAGVGGMAGDASAGNGAAGTSSAGTSAAGTDAAGTDAAGTDAAGTGAAGTGAAGTGAAGTGTVDNCPNDANKTEPGVCGCGTPDTDTDGDSVADCTEDADGDDFTDANVFNGAHVRLGNQCSAAGNCTENNTLAKVDACMNGNVNEELDQSSGWAWSANPPDNACDAAYDFKPAWTACDNTWAADWQAYVNLAAGTHCFQLLGGTSEGCAALFISTTVAASFGGWSTVAASTVPDTQSGGAAKCVTLAAGVYPIRWHYTMDNGSSSSMQLAYCHDASAACTPTQPLPASMLRVSP